ncbi:electron transport complex subunit D [Cellvibrio zantedeschiae]|uniref:Ion-translocating oxidoreductase complex subunit D n=1 Tax=Cellvibrio zantedeschiae TaxID=1237077 RepID=A0ABQ3AWH4_9GAMM|nr:electron transport complex subunit RsxD [Cellvibrio zantedeschiae]GGY68884.1 electron transport complex subunit D [Cellvibrio zantedeschiae]
MALLNITSPHTHGPLSTAQIMRLVIYALVPGILTLAYFFGSGVFLNLIIASLSCLGFEAAILKLRSRPIGFYLRDYSALVTAFLLAVSLPPYCPWWLVVTGSFCAIVLAKQLYGGMGLNPFNPAMVAYVILLVSFPIPMTQWATPATLDGAQAVSISEALGKIFIGQQVDGYASATVLDVMKQNSAFALEEIYKKEPLFKNGYFASAGWEWVNIAFLIGGLFLLYKKIFTWHAPISMLIALTLMAIIFYDNGSSHSGGSPVFHLLSGATMLGAFFIVTDPVTSAVSKKGRIIYGAAIGVLIYVIRVWGKGYPDGVAFAVLFLNFAAPFIDYYTTPRTYGHKKARVVIAKDSEEK